MIFVTGDKHGELGMGDLSSKNWPEGKTLTKKDYLIIAGDFGLIWTKKDNVEEYWLKWLNDKPWTTLWVDGNHENHARLAEEFEDVDMFGSSVGKTSDSVFHLKRGNVYNIEGKLFFTMGGAKSIDRNSRKPGKTWWPQEVPSPEEKEKGYKILEKMGDQIDFVISHTAPETLIRMYFATIGLSSRFTELDSTRLYLDDVFRTCRNAEYYCGHWHDEWDSGRFHMLYHSIKKIV